MSSQWVWGIHFNEFATHRLNQHISRGTATHDTWVRDARRATVTLKAGSPD